MTRSKFLPILALFAAAGCVDTPAPNQDVPTEPERTVAQPVVDRAGDNWLVAGDDGLLEVVGGQDGEPDVVTGRFVLDGNVITDAGAAADRWVLVGSGQSQPVDDNAQRLRDTRTILQGEDASFIKPGTVGWMIGGGDGRIQLMDTEGEPTANEAQPFAGQRVVDGAWNGLSWLVGATGKVSRCQLAGTLTCGTPKDTLGGAAIRAVVARAEPNNQTPSGWFVFSADSYEATSGVGTPDGSPTLIESNLDIRDAIFADGKIAVATGDGRFGLMDPATMTTPTWQNILSGNGATKIEWSGTEYLVLGELGWAHRVGADGVPIGNAVQLATKQSGVAARFVNGGWSIAMGAIGFVEFAANDLAPLRTLTPVLPTRVTAAAPNGLGETLLVGLGGEMAMVDDLGVLSSSHKLTGGEDLLVVSWNGSEYLVAGKDGFTQLIDKDGSPIGTPVTHNDGVTINFAAWSGEFWLIGGGSTVQRLRGDNTEAAAPVTLEGFDNALAARWSGSRWLVAGDGSNDNAVYAMVQRDGTASAGTELVDVPGAIYAVEFTGLEFLLGGTDGMVQRVGGEGAIVDQPFDALNGLTIRALYFNGENYLVGGEFGGIRRLSPELQPLRAPIAVLDQRPVRAITWTRTRGFASGICISNDFCYQGPCVGGLANGQCCDSACDRVCESCFAGDTGEPDGTCAPVVADKQPPNKPGSQGCGRETEATCGRTGFCDGAGACQFYSDDIQCGDALCVSGEFTPVAMCDGMGACQDDATESCAPYNSCTSEGCATTCESDVSCIEGYICDAGTCIEDPDADPDKPDDQDPSEDEGCCSTVRSGPSFSGLWLLMAGLVGLFVTRRRR